MSKLKLIIGNKNYSSWSLRPWLFMRKNTLDFAEQIIWLDTPTFQQEVQPFGSNGTVPALVDDKLQVWDSLAIIDYLIDTQKLQYTWPQDKAQRALARSMSAEMHSGYSALRSQLSMDIRLRKAYKTSDVHLQGDIDRIISLWTQAFSMRDQQAGGWLFGGFSAADAMLVPVVFRFDSYSIPVPSQVRAYMDHCLADEDVRQWVDDGKDEVVLPDHG